MKASRWKLSMLALSSLGLAALPVWGYSYTWLGESSNDWCGQFNDWTRTGCGNPCPECPDDSLDSATISLPVNIDNTTKTIGMLIISNADVRIGTPTGPNCLTTEYSLSVKSVTVTASAGQTAILRSTSCQIIGTY